jgi:K+-sensing histidine kinase KdpD
VLNAYALPPPPPVKENVERARMLSVRAIEASLQRLGAVKITAAIAHGAIGEPATEIVRFASAVDADLVVVGSHSRQGLDRFFLGSVAEKVVRRSGCPVLVVRPKQHAPVSKEPQVEPPCDDCLKRRAETKGQELWCARHSEHHPRAHVFHYEGVSNDAARPWGFDAQ